MEIYNVVKRIIGKIEPYGDTNIDAERYENLINHTSVTSDLISDLIEVAKYKDRPEHSMNQIGFRAYVELCDIKDMIDNVIEEENEVNGSKNI